MHVWPGHPSRTAAALRCNYGNIYTGRPVKQHVTRGRTLRCDVMSVGRGSAATALRSQRPARPVLIGIRPKYPGVSVGSTPARRGFQSTSPCVCVSGLLPLGRHFDQSHLKVVQFRWYVGRACCHRDGDDCVVDICSKTDGFERRNK